MREYGPKRVVFCQRGFYSRYKQRWHHLADAARRHGWDVTVVVPTHVVSLLRHRLAGTSAACRVPARMRHLMVPVPTVCQRVSPRLRRWVRGSWERQVASLRSAFPDSVVVVQDPNFPESVLDWHRHMLVHDVVDDYLGIEGPTARNRELGFAAQSDVVTVTAEGLRGVFADVAPAVRLVPNGVALHDYGAVSREARDEKRAVFMGTLGSWVDGELLRRAARMARDWEFLIIGSMVPRERRKGAWPRNVRFVGRRPYEDLPDYLSRCSVGLVPFRTDDPVAQAADPLKFYEYLAAGLPVVATPIEPLNRFASNECVFLAGSPDEFVKAMERAHSQRRGLVPEMTGLAAQNSWDARWEQLESIFRTCGNGRTRQGGRPARPASRRKGIGYRS